MWCVWQNRNDVVWNSRCKIATVVFQSALDIQSQWIKAKQDSAGHSLVKTQLGFPSWKRPPENVLKCNVEAAVFESSSHIGYGCIVRNSDDVVIDATYGTLMRRFNPTTAEALSIKEALSWLKSVDCSQIIVESDALLVIKALNNSEPDSSSLSLIVEDCKILARDFSSCHFVFVFRSRIKRPMLWLEKLFLGLAC
ncbi:uncharacterized protein [Henckelia pumila]|uniref:uncharacterized protein n=1 Tax=Henckelia pumila TaxID=405737 RepID=UPI003C6DFBB2